VPSLTERIRSAIEEIKTTSINGCVTGSCMLDADFDTWDTPPDVDVFTYGELYMVDAVCQLRALGYEWGKDEERRSAEQEATKYEWLLQGKRNKSESLLQTLKLHRDGVCVNVSCRKYQRTVSDVIANFDMTIIMKGYDIRLGALVDYTGCYSDPHVAILNPLRKQDTDMWTIAKWVRQYDRVIKYWNRGFDTRPACRSYVEMIDEFLERGALWTSPQATEAYESFAAEFKEHKERMLLWLKDKEDC